MNATLAAWLDYDIADVGTGGLALADFVAGGGAALLASITGSSRRGPHRAIRHRPETARRSNPAGRGSSIASPSAPTARPEPRAPSFSTARRERSPAEDLRAAEVRFARVFNSTPVAIAILDKDGTDRAVERGLRATDAARLSDRRTRARAARSMRRSSSVIVARWRSRSPPRPKASPTFLPSTSASTVKANARRCCSSRASDEGESAGRHDLCARHHRAAHAAAQFRASRKR